MEKKVITITAFGRCHTGVRIGGTLFVPSGSEGVFIGKGGETIRKLFPSQFVRVRGEAPEKVKALVEQAEAEGKAQALQEVRARILAELPKVRQEALDYAAGVMASPYVQAVIAWAREKEPECLSGRTEGSLQSALWVWSKVRQAAGDAYRAKEGWTKRPTPVHPGPEPVVPPPVILPEKQIGQEDRLERWFSNKTDSYKEAVYTVPVMGLGDGWEDILRERLPAYGIDPEAVIAQIKGLGDNVRIEKVKALPVFAEIDQKRREAEQAHREWAKACTAWEYCRTVKEGGRVILFDGIPHLDNGDGSYRILDFRQDGTPILPIQGSFD